MFGSFKGITREQECDRILNVSGHDQHEVAFRALDVQFQLLHSRAQVLLGICGVLLSASVVLMTGKILGRAQLQHQEVIRPLLVTAGASVIGAAGTVVGGVLRIRWMTELPGKDLRGWVMTSLLYRDRKTMAYRAGMVLLLCSMAFFQAAATLAWLQ